MTTINLQSWQPFFRVLQLVVLGGSLGFVVLGGMWNNHLLGFLMGLIIGVIVALFSSEDNVNQPSKKA